jgi:hypothetical protein
MTLLYHEVPVAVFTPEVRRAITRTALLDPWADLGREGEGTAAVLSQPVLEAGIPLPPIAMYPLYRAGICLSGYSSRLALLFNQVRDLTWWGWPVLGKAFLAADWQYRRPLDDPAIREVIYQLFEQPFHIQVTVHAAQSVNAIVTQVLEQLASMGYPLESKQTASRTEEVKERF